MNQPTAKAADPGKHTVPLRVVFAYAVFASLWIILSDQVVETIARWTGLNEITHLFQTGKGLLFVLITSLLLYLAIRRHTETLRRSREELHEREEMYRAVFEASNDGLCIEELDGTILNANPAFCRMHGYGPEELRGMKVTDLAHPDYRHLLERTDVQLDQPGGNQHRMLDLRKDGTVLAVDVHSGRLTYGGRPCVLSVFRDITDRQRAEEALRLSEQRFRTLFDHATEAILVFDADTRRFIDANENALQLTRRTRQQLCEAGPETLCPPVQPDGRSSREASMGYDQQALAGGTPVFEWMHRDGTGQDVPCEVRLVRLPAAGRNLLRASVTDISERKRAQEALARQAEELARSNTELERFAYVASHDLQEPLRMVSSYTQLLARRYQGRLDADADEFIAYAVEGVTQMQALINDLLAYSRVSSQGRPPVPTQVAPAIERALANLQFAVQESAAVITQDPMPEIMADPVQLVQVFQNLLSNAVKFRRDEPPSIRVSARREGREWVFSIADNGIGIEAEYLDRVFVIFQRLHPRAEYPGTGMGLTICKRIVERHGGHVWVESRLGEGSTFYFTFPAVPDEPS